MSYILSEIQAERLSQSEYISRNYCASWIMRGVCAQAALMMAPAVGTLIRSHHRFATFFFHLIFFRKIKMHDPSPRQARDRCEESWNKRSFRRTAEGAPALDTGVGLSAPRQRNAWGCGKRPSCSNFYYLPDVYPEPVLANHRVAWEKLTYWKGAFSAGLLDGARDAAHPVAMEVFDPNHGAKVRKRSLFCAIYTLNALFYQDRLGTNIGKALKKGTVFSQVRTRLLWPTLSYYI
jgi:hypothetical protein